MDGHEVRRLRRERHHANSDSPQASSKAAQRSRDAREVALPESPVCTPLGKSKGRCYTPAEVSRIMAQVIGAGPDTKRDQTVYDPTCGSGSLLIKAADEAQNGLTVYGQEKHGAPWTDGEHEPHPSWTRGSYCPLPECLARQAPDGLP